MAKEARGQTKDVRSLASQSGTCSGNPGNRTHGGHGLPCQGGGGEVHSELFSHPAVSGWTGHAPGDWLL